ncbi:MAG: outer membrane protein assembly factor [Muribaculaceae bacterium]|nr:outer membrane protein assembly factor [Muribaculaceae bacterium]
MRNRNFISTLQAVAAIMLTLLCAGCSTTRHVPDGRYLLDDVSLIVDDPTGTLDGQTMMSYIRQRPNNRVLHISRLRLGVYNMSGNDSTKWWNKWMRRLGEAPVIYDPAATQSDSSQLLKAMRNAGFLGSSVGIDSFPDSRHKKIRLRYRLDAGLPHIIDTVAYEFPDDTLRRVIMRDSSRFIVRAGDRLDRGELETQRQLITERMRDRGYWAFSKEFITFSADTTEGSRLVGLTMTVHPPYPLETRKNDIDTHRVYTVRDIVVITDYDGTLDTGIRDFAAKDTVRYKDLTILYGNKEYLRPQVIYENCFLRRGAIFSQHDVDNTYEAFGRLSILKFVQVRMMPVVVSGDTGLLDAYILLTPNRSQSVALEVEGTNSEGDLGVALGVNYTHRNAGRGSETLNFKLRGSYQAINGHLDGFIHNRFMEYGVETSVTFPKFKAPLLRENFKKKIKASTELHISMNYQERPEYTRIISTAGWSYKWSEHSSRYRYTFTPIDINYVYLPKSTNGFLDQIAPDNPLLRYSYEDHFIMRAGFNFYYTTKHKPSPFRIQREKNVMTVRAQAETAGNLLFGISRAVNPHRDFHEDPYKVFGINYAQYVRADADFSYLHSFDRRNALACYAGFGIGIPYGNSSILPFEKRFYGGGANGVRGWDVRTLGPGRFPGTNSVSDFIYQCGDIRLNFSIEYRAKLFWVIEGGLFIDAGNIWTIRNYATQPYGLFRFNSFYKELAAAYGAGIRMDFNYFLVRFDLGMKAHNPAINQEPWPLLHPKWGRDHSFHFSIGYPF